MINDTSISSLIDSETSDDDSSCDDLSMPQLLLSLTSMDEELLFNDNGYIKQYKICNTLQGELFKAENINNGSYVAIKKTDKHLFAEQIANDQDKDNPSLQGFKFCVSENIIKESLILKYLTVDNCPIGDYIVKYIDNFESDTHYYLVMEYIDSEMNLKQFVTKSFEYINNGKLSLKSYHKMMKYLLWQLFVTINWLHQSMNCMSLQIQIYALFLIRYILIHVLINDPLFHFVMISAFCLGSSGLISLLLSRSGYTAEDEE